VSDALVLETRSAAETRAVGQALGALLTGGEVVALGGALGAGKTCFVQGLAAGLGVSGDEPVISPTFVLLREYAGRLRLHHLDAYRLAGPDELYDLGFAELAAAGGVVAIEWAERVAALLPADACCVELEHAGADRRRIAVRWSDARRLSELAWRAAPVG
jgi:tRNA threonylcarbamoyladenosine biosynthesis protein TsaE